MAASQVAQRPTAVAAAHRAVSAPIVVVAAQLAYQAAQDSTAAVAHLVAQLATVAVVRQVVPATAGVLAAVVQQVAQGSTVAAELQAARSLTAGAAGFPTIGCPGEVSCGSLGTVIHLPEAEFRSLRSIWACCSTSVFRCFWVVFYLGVLTRV